MDAKFGKQITIDAYKNSYTIFALQRQHPLEKDYGARISEVNGSAPYLGRVHQL
ncbi:hypothetical protein PS15m_010408 [Mucor circinelloides]